MPVVVMILDRKFLGGKQFCFLVSFVVKIYKTIVFPVMIYGCETWSLTLREEWRLRVFANRILRRTFGPKRDENGKWRRPTMRNFIVCTVHLM